MKLKKLEQWILLEQSGELSVRRQKRLACELARSPEARRLRDELRLVSRSIREPAAAPSPWMATRIDAQLRREPSSAPLLISNVWKPVLAMAACLAVALGLWTFQGEQVRSEPAAVPTAAVNESDVWDDSLGEDLSELEDLIVALSDSSFDIMEM